MSKAAQQFETSIAQPAPRRLGAHWTPGGRCSFLVWAPRAKTVELHIVHPAERSVPMRPLARGYFSAVLEDVPASSRYFYCLDERCRRADPASQFQPEGVHGPSQVADARFDWTDAGWRGLPIQQYVMYELHPGAFSPEGTFAGIIPRLPELKSLGITAIEVMPISQFPGDRNWGYDGVYPFAAQNSYGGPREFKRLVDACHARGLAVVLDVVYNHLGPEGNYLADFGPYFTDHYQTPWGAAINFDQESSDEVRRYFVDNALQWVAEFHVDALRLDAIHAIFDESASTFLEELGLVVHGRARELGREIFLIAESNRNDPRFVTPREWGGIGLDAEWNDDFHHSLRVLLSGETGGYYQDFGGVEKLARAFRDGFVFTGQYSRYRAQHYGKSSAALPGRSFVVFSQNHDQVGNRLEGDRLAARLPIERLKLAAAAVLLSPFLPLLFMGEEYGERAPFNYFVSHGDPALVEAVRKGRREEFAAFAWGGEVPDPQDERTFLASKLNWGLRRQGEHAALLNFYAELLRLRRTIPALSQLAKERTEATPFEAQKVLLVRRWAEESQVFAMFHFGEESVSIALPIPAGRWRLLLDSPESHSGLPAELDSPGEIKFSLRPSSFALFLEGKPNTAR
ncbi:MAG TPA: malto-oligosyltrehalose trehalohydrolase [Candidatus Acidoferrales bacterium]|nr:malto-oligosyltrehalose trehalohydrolase [Candidatus Acidoferrales bacterium]